MDKKSLYIRRAVLTALSVAAVGFIFYNSSLPADESSQQSGGLLEVVNSLLRMIDPRWGLTDHMIRKAAHFTEYTVLGCLLCLMFFSYVGRRMSTALFTLPTGLIVAVCDELIQTLSEGRSCEATDVLIDFCGVLCGSMAVLLILTIRLKRREKRKAFNE